MMMMMMMMIIIIIIIIIILASLVLSSCTLCWYEIKMYVFWLLTLQKVVSL